MLNLQWYEICFPFRFATKQHEKRQPWCGAKSQFGTILMKPVLHYYFCRSNRIFFVHISVVVYSTVPARDTSGSEV
jgi:hypothetical protein